MEDSTDRFLNRFKRIILVFIFINTTVLVVCLANFDVQKDGNGGAKSFMEIVENLVKEQRSKQKPINYYSRNDNSDSYQPKFSKRRSPPIFNGPQNSRQKEIVGAFLNSWKEYRRHAWGKDELRPITQTYDNEYGLGLTIIDSLDTAIIMGLDKEVKASIEWLEHDFKLKNTFVNTFETTIRVLGGLLSAYHLTGEPIFEKHAKIIGDGLLGAFVFTPFPLNRVNLATSTGASLSQYSTLAEIGSLQLEFRELSEITKDPRYVNAIERANKMLLKNNCPGETMCSSMIDVFAEKFIDTVKTVGAKTDSFYEYLLKQYLQTGEVQYLKSWNTAINSIENQAYRKLRNNKTFIIGEIEMSGDFNPKMDHLACFLPGSLALSYLQGHELAGKHLEMAENIAETCYKMYKTPTGLAPEMIYWKGSRMVAKTFDRYSLLRPEALESFFYLYRITGNRKYQDWSWEIFQAIQKYAKLPTGGYTSIANVFETENVERFDKMESFFLAETLKYLYLTMADDQMILPLDQWVFNTEAHPLPIYHRKEGK